MKSDLAGTQQAPAGTTPAGTTPVGTQQPAGAASGGDIVSFG